MSACLAIFLERKDKRINLIIAKKIRYLPIKTHTPMKKLILSLTFLSIFGISCQQDDPPTPVAIVKYMSLSAGSTWNYELVNNLAVTTSTYVLSSTTRDSTINGKSYHVFTNSSGSANEYHNITGNDYYNFRNLPGALGGSSVENIYLKDNAAVGATWSQTYPVTVSGVALNTIITNTITEKGISKTVKGTVYNDVIHVTTAITVTIGAIPLPASALTTNIHFYYAPKFGLIQSSNVINLNYAGIIDNTNQQTSLVSANIK